jgi:subfamily B ATP-binding cassette protein MsbA
MSDSKPEASRKEKIAALRDVASYRPRFTIGIIVLGVFAAVFEGVGLSFVLPIVELVRTSDPSAAEGLMGVFVSVYQTAGVPLTLGTAVLGVSLVMVIRYTSSFGVGWLREILRTYYIRDLQDRAFRNALDAKVAYYDKQGSDDILNAIVTQTYYAGRVIRRAIQVLEQSLIAGVYLLIALVISPWLTLFTAVVLGGFTVFFRRVLESGYDIGSRVADANEKRQEAAQAGTQGIRDIRIFGVADELYEDFQDAIDKYTQARILQRRNSTAIDKFYNLVVAVSVFVLIYLVLTFADLSLGALGVFLFAMFRLGPRLSNVNRLFYQVENDLAHLDRTLNFISELSKHKEPNNSDQKVPREVTQISFDDVWFSYNDDEQILRGINFNIEKGEFVGFVGQSGAGKSTIVSLLSRMYEVDSGEIRANGIPIDEMDLERWRSKITVVRQDPFIFNKSLRYNLTIGNRGASETELDRVCEIAKVVTPYPPT